MKNLITCILLSTLTACASSKYDVQGRVDLNERSVAMPASGGDVLRVIKRELRREGWKIVVLDNVLTSMQVGRHVVTSKASAARYTLLFESDRRDTCITGEGTYRVDAALIDNNSNEEVFNYEAFACEDDIAANILSLMRGETPAKPKFSGN